MDMGDGGECIPEIVEMIGISTLEESVKPESLWRSAGCQRGVEKLGKSRTESNQFR